MVHGYSIVKVTDFFLYKMEYSLESYGNFEAEQQVLAAAARKKEECERQEALDKQAFEYRLKVIKGYFLRLSWKHKKDYILCVVKKMTSLETILKIIGLISSLYGKVSSYADVSTHVRHNSEQILLDHDRTMDKDFLKEVVCEDLKWMEDLDKYRQLRALMSLMPLGGRGLMRKLYIPLVCIYNAKIAEEERIKQEKGVNGTQRDVQDLFKKTLDDSDMYARDHPQTIEVEKMRKKWDDMMEKYLKEVFGISSTSIKPPKAKKTEGKSNKKDKKKAKAKANKNEKKSTNKTSKGSKGSKALADSLDAVQILPVWIVKKIFSYLDQKTLQTVKKVNRYWSYASDSVLKDRQARKFLDQQIESIKNNIDPEILKKSEEEGASGSNRKCVSPRKQRLEKLIIRGAVHKSMIPKVKKSDQVQTNLVTMISKGDNVCSPIDKISVFPRLIQDDALLYKEYPCPLKDVNILIEVEDDVQKMWNTLSYSLSQQLSDTFSMSEANLADW